jgi:hypothetical protein
MLVREDHSPSAALIHDAPDVISPEQLPQYVCPA